MNIISICRKDIIFKFVCLLLLASSVFVVSRSFPDTMIEPKWYVALAVFTCGGFVLATCFLLSGRRFECGNKLTQIEIITVGVCTAQAVFGILQFAGLVNGYGHYAAGSFENPAGFASCLCFSLPMGFRLFRRFSTFGKVAFIICKLLCMAAVVMSGSRTGMLCIMVCAVLLFGSGKKLMLWIMPAMVVAVMVLTLAMKTDSSRGRWFICQRTVELIAERPITGWGIGGFEAKYMDVQADYFAHHVDSEYAMLADSIHHPMNEYLLVAVDFGLIGLLVLLAAIFGTVVYYRHHPSDYGRLGMQIMICIAVFSMFSYPFLYPFTWIMLLVACCCVYKNRIFHRRIVCVSAIVILPILGYMLAVNWAMSMELRRIQEKASYGLAKNMMPRYAKLYPKQKADYRFLYNYAAEQYEAGLYAEALHTANECEKLLSDYDISLLKADIYRELGQDKLAMVNYQQAYNMCPSRFVPLYEIYNIYRSRKDTINYRRIANIILTKPIKVKSKDTMDMIEEVRDETE